MEEKVEENKTLNAADIFVNEVVHKITPDFWTDLIEVIYRVDEEDIAAGREERCDWLVVKKLAARAIRPHRRRRYRRAGRAGAFNRNLSSYTEKGPGVKSARPSWSGISQLS
jgi:hypothetical protein